ncbi:putative 3-isopropylmalate protein [Xylariomycetidae sp. FL0641]|nr:putative 3-isopropylmalate protein [Xylariomycetidae sp. FL0641]
MSEVQSPDSFGDPNAQPPTPKQTPTSAGFPNAVFETPKANQGSFEDPSGWTPRFAEEYSVFNSTPGNIGGSQGSFLDFAASTPYPSSLGHKRLHSAEVIAAQIATHVNHFSPNPNLPLPPVDLSRRLASSPGPVSSESAPTEESPWSASQQPTVNKKVRRNIAPEPQGQTPTPPPSARKGARRLAPKLQSDNMQDEEFGQEFLAATPQQQQHIPNFATTPVDMFGVPLSAPATAPVITDSRIFWDAMDLDFSASGVHMFQTPSHRPMNSLDWGKSNEIFQQTGVAPHQSQENKPLPRKERVLAPKPPMPTLDTSMVGAPLLGAPFPTPVDDPFPIMNQDRTIGGLDPGLLFTRPPSSGMDPAVFDPMAQPSLMQSFPGPELIPFTIKESKRGHVRRSASTKESGPGRKVDRASASSPVKSTSRPGLSRSFSESRGRRSAGRLSSLPNLAPAIRPESQPAANRPSSQGSRISGRASPSKNHPPSGLTAIPESAPRTRTSVRFTIDARGRARAETTIIVDDEESGVSTVRRQQPSHSPEKSWHSSGDEDSSTDDEPIIIPSRNTSFALAEPPKPTVFRQQHSSQRSFSEQSTSSLGIYYNEPISTQNDAESEAETILNGPESGNSNGGRRKGDAASELRKVREKRQQKASERRLSKGAAIAGALVGVGNTAPPMTSGEGGAATPVSHRGNQIRFWPGIRSAVVAEAIKVLKAVESSSPAAGKFNLQEHKLGGCSIDAHGSPLTDSALDAAKVADAVLLGAIGGPEWGTGAVRPEQGLLRLRKEMGTYGNLRPCFFPSASLVDFSPLKADVCRGTDFTVVRELTGGIYFGARKEDDGDGTAWDTEPYSRAEVERITRLAAHLALARDPPAPVWSLDKANVLATSRLWRKVVSETMQNEFPQLTLHHQLIDSAAMVMVKNPRGLNGVVVTSNLFGDIVSDEASVIPGSIGLSPSASLSGIPDGKNRCNGIYEPIHGSAPDISGKGIVNPIGTILSIAMMCRYSLRLPKEADAIEAAVRNVLDAGVRTKDLGGETGTKEMGDAVVAELNKILKA